MQSWATEELKYVQPGDERLNKRLMKIRGDLIRWVIDRHFIIPLIS